MMTRHDRGAFVPKVDFVCGAGFLDGGTSRTDRGLPEGGPKLVVTPLGVFDFEPASKAMRIKSLHDGVTLDEVRDNTGFDLLVPATQIERTPPPTDEELFLLRASSTRPACSPANFPGRKPKS